MCTVYTDNCGVPTWCFMLERFLMFSSCNFSPDSFHGNLSRVFWFIMIPGFKAYSLPDNTPDTTPRLINYFNYFHQEMFWGGLVPEAYTGGGYGGSSPPLGSVNSMVSRGFQYCIGIGYKTPDLKLCIMMSFCRYYLYFKVSKCFVYS